MTEEGERLDQRMDSAVNLPLPQLYRGLNDRDIAKLHKLLQVMDENIVSSYMEYKVQAAMPAVPPEESEPPSAAGDLS